MAQKKLEVQLASVAKGLEPLAGAQRNKASNVAAYIAYSRPLNQSRQQFNNYEQKYRHHSPPGIRPPSDSINSSEITKLVEEEFRCQTRFLAPTNRPPNKGIPSSRNRRTTDGLPICNNCDKVGHITRNCRNHPRQPPRNQIPTQNQTQQTSQQLRPSAEIVSSRRTNNHFDRHSGS